MSHPVPFQAYLSDHVPTSFEDIVDRWEADEADQPMWQKHFIEQGFATWRAWRQMYIDQFGLSGLAWASWQLSRAEEAIPQWYGASFTSWRAKHYRGKPFASFAELATRPALQKNTKIQELIAHFPSPTQLVGVYHRDRIFIVEGMHRACALAIASSLGVCVARDVRIALAHVPQPPRRSDDSDLSAE